MGQFQIPTATQPIIQTNTKDKVDRFWYRFFQGLFGKSDNNVTATGTTQADAYPISQIYTEFLTVPANSGAILATTPCVTQYVYNFGAHTLNIYPPVGAQIDALGTNTATTVAAGGHARFAVLYPTQVYTS